MVDPNGGLWRACAAFADKSASVSMSVSAFLRSNATVENSCEPSLDAVRRPRDTPIWKLEASLKCRSCPKGRYAPPVHTIKLTETREITPYPWVRPDEER
jgi:hypothetical protein